VDRALTSTTMGIEGYRVVRHLGVVRGVTVRSRGLVGQMAAAMRTIVGGRIHEYIELCEQSRAEAFEQMLSHATELGANAVIGVRYDATELGENMSEVLAYGTAVVVERL
jgi:uncharacterized protein YbjQ (UPF0145 family)